MAGILQSGCLLQLRRMDGGNLKMSQNLKIARDVGVKAMKRRLWRVNRERVVENESGAPAANLLGFQAFLRRLLCFPFHLHHLNPTLIIRTKTIDADMIIRTYLSIFLAADRQ